MTIEEVERIAKAYYISKKLAKQYTIIKCCNRVGITVASYYRHKDNKLYENTLCLKVTEMRKLNKIYEALAQRISRTAMMKNTDLKQALVKLIYKEAREKYL